MISGLTERIEQLEERNQSLTESLNTANIDLDQLRKRATDLQSERVQFASQVSSLKSVVSSEGSAGKVLERISGSSPSSSSGRSSDLKLEIYKQQIVYLTSELDKLRKF